MRTIEITIDGCVVTRSGKTAGAQGEGNVTALRLSFDESWRGLGKRIIWRDAQGEQPVAVVLFDPEAGSDTLRYGTLIPGEPLSLPGWCSATIEGYTTDADGTVRVSRTAEFRLQVLMNDGLYAPVEPSPSEVAQIYDLLGKAEDSLHGYAVDCAEAALLCKQQENELAQLTAQNRTYADLCKFYADTTHHTATGLGAVEADVAELTEAVSGKLDRHLGSEYDGLFLSVDQNGDIVPTRFSGGGVVTSVGGKTGAVRLDTYDVTAPSGDSLQYMLEMLESGKADRYHPTNYAGKLWAVGEDGDLCFVDNVPLDDTLSQTGKAADAAVVGQCFAALPVSVAADGYTDITGLRKVTGINMAAWDSGAFALTLDGGITNHYRVGFDAQRRPVTVEDAAGHTTMIVWG